VKAGRIQKLKLLLTLDPSDSFSRYALALEYPRMNDPAQAGSLLEELISWDSRYLPAYQQLGYLYQNVGRREEAVSILKRGMQVAAQQGDPHAKSEMEEALVELLG
jgi:Tfp pilus assembly protein PilF